MEQAKQTQPYNMTMTFCRGMATKKCAREECGKTVYPLEELNCLDKTWHKGCFRCTSCGMALNMKNYRGYNRMPYCEPHYPKTVATSVVDTPEMQRVAVNTRLQSQHQYHAEYEKMKGTKIDIVDDPEISRHLKNTKDQSSVQYHGEAEKKQKQEASRPIEDPNAKPQTVKLSETSIQLSRPVDSNDYNVDDAVYALTFERTDSNAQLDADFRDQQTNKENFATTIWSSNTLAFKDPEPVKVGSIADYDPLAAEKKAAEESTKTTTTASATGGAAKKTTKKAKTTGYAVKALYDYTAADSDEISFKEGDTIVNCQAVDEGWLTGTHQKTLEHGMLPANYVQKIVEKTGQARLA
ncbi:hypothetical protein M3Y97_01057600 [Aphelenchoides bicaudatus]|nr:hypothetical protein M3Y97_01057600 [Aphelenchoides bicaudatus]